MKITKTKSPQTVYKIKWGNTTYKIEPIKQGAEFIFFECSDRSEKKIDICQHILSHKCICEIRDLFEELATERYENTRFEPDLICKAVRFKIMGLKEHLLYEEPKNDRK